MKKLGIYKYYALFILIYSLGILFMPPNEQTMATYHLNETAYRTLLFSTLALPSFLTWLAAFYGFSQLDKYVELIKSTKEGKAFEGLKKGGRWLMLYLPIASIVTLLLTAIANSHASFRGSAEVISNYVTIVIALLAFSAVSRGARDLAEVTDARPSLLKTRLLAFSFIVMGVLYCYFIIKHGLNSRTSAYHMPIGALLLTVVVPYFYAWMLGLLAVLDIDAYATKVTGVLYRKALQMLSGGLLIVVGSSILLQYVNSASLQRGRLVLGGWLFVRYVLYAGLAAGFGLIAHSAKKLQQIEKI